MKLLVNAKEEPDLKQRVLDLLRAADQGNLVLRYLMEKQTAAALRAASPGDDVNTHRAQGAYGILTEILDDLQK